MSDKNGFIEELEAMRARMEELFVRDFETEGNQTGSDAEWEESAGVWVPPADIMDSENELTYLLDLPGVFDQDLQVECRADRLWVHGVKLDNVTVGEVLSAERVKGAFSRVFKLPCPIREDAISAEFKKGVLRIVVPKKCTTDNRIQKVPVRRED